LQVAVTYTLTPGSGSAINGTSVPFTHSGVAADTWTCAYVSGGPAGAYVVNPPSQTLTGGGTITFTLNFEKNQDAAIQWITWTANGVPWQTTTWEGIPCNIIDVHFLQWVMGCVGYNVTLNETDWIMITQTQPAQGPNAMIVVRNDDCALNKTPIQGASPVKKSQVPSVNNVTREQGYNITLTVGEPTTLDVHTVWQLVKGTNYTKSINWFGISAAVQGEQTFHNCTLFELVLPKGPVQYQFQVIAFAHVDLVGATDNNTANNDAMSLFPLTVVVNMPP
jgi:hypothetical protein